MVIPWIGFPLADLIARLEPTGKAKYVAFTTLHDPEQMPGQKRNVLQWPYVEGLRLDEAMNPLAILAVGLYGKILPNQNGAPLRLVVPWKYGFKGIKSIVEDPISRRPNPRPPGTSPPPASTASTRTSIRTSITRDGARRRSGGSASFGNETPRCSTDTPIRWRGSTRGWT